MSRVYCDGMRRRDMLRIGVAGLFGGGLSLGSLMQAHAATEGAHDTGKSVILVFLKGGLSTIDTLDMKPRAPAEFRGEFNPIPTNVPGIDVCEHLPTVARHADKFSLLRGFGHRNSDHGPADHYMLTGYHPIAGFNPGLSPNNQRPAHGAIVAKMLGPRGSVPAYVALPQLHASAGPAYLGPTCAPLAITADPNSPDFSVPDIVPPLSLAASRIGARRELLKTVDQFQ
ncbi:MAG TPA: DUF1501 domain-containing protein, partial [Pirellulaceae bacterium]|nr:DUF1501 domain-containing protein [Pirellulaceae bacterium]